MYQVGYIDVKTGENKYRWFKTWRGAHNAVLKRRMNDIPAWHVNYN